MNSYKMFQEAERDLTYGWKMKMRGKFYDKWLGAEHFLYIATMNSYLNGFNFMSNGIIETFN